MRIILRQSALYAIAPTVSGLLGKSEVLCIDQCPPVFQPQGPDYVE